MAIPITDPMVVPVYGDSMLHRWCQRALYDPRDEVFVRLTLKVTAMMLPILAMLLFSFHWAVVALYLVTWAWMSAPVILMLHCTMHRPLLRGRWARRVHPYWLSFLFGIPTGYADHHIGMHHAENNLPDDLSSTIRFQRDSFLHFLVYFARFFFIGIIEVSAYLGRTGKRMMMFRLIFGEVGHVAVIAGACAVSLPGGLVGFALPFVVVRVLMMMGNWGQHAFVDAEQPGNSLLNSITCINSGYNQRAFNDGYHIGHHVKANRHWAELPGDFLANVDLYAKNGCVVFTGLDFFLVSLLLFLKQYRMLARRFVRLDGKERSDAEVIAFLKTRLRPIPAVAPEAASLRVA